MTIATGLYLCYGVELYSAAFGSFFTELLRGASIGSLLVFGLLGIDRVIRQHNGMGAYLCLFGGAGIAHAFGLFLASAAQSATTLLPQAVGSIVIVGFGVALLISLREGSY